MNTWNVDTNVGKAGFPESCCTKITELHLENSPSFLQIEHDGNFLSFLTMTDICYIDEVNDKNGELVKAVSKLEKGQSYFEPEAGMTIVRLSERNSRVFDQYGTLLETGQEVAVSLQTHLAKGRITRISADEGRYLVFIQLKYPNGDEHYHVCTHSRSDTSERVCMPEILVIGG